MFTENLFTMRRLGDFVPSGNPLRPVREILNQALKNIKPLPSGMYAAEVQGGRPSVAPEKVLRAMLLQIFYSIRSQRMLMEQTQYNLQYRWFIGLSMVDSAWVPTVSWHAPSVRTTMATTADGYAEREAAKALIADAKQAALEQARITLGMDKGDDVAGFIAALTDIQVLTHVAQNTSNRQSAVPEHIANSIGSGRCRVCRPVPHDPRQPPRHRPVAPGPEPRYPVRRRLLGLSAVDVVGTISPADTAQAPLFMRLASRPFGW